MSVRLATVHGGGTWEPRLVRAIRETGVARVVARCRGPAETEAAIARADGLVLAPDAAWVSRALLRRWAGRIALVGVAEPGDRAGRALLDAGGCAAVLHPDDPPVRFVRAVAAGPGVPQPTAAPVAIGGPRGAPGRSETALALAWALARHGTVLLAELDSEAPSLLVRAALPPADDVNRADPGVAIVPRHRRFGPVSVLPAPPTGSALGPALRDRLVEAARAAFDAVVLDAGPGAAPLRAARPSLPVLVVDATPVGVLRAAALAAAWPPGPPPAVVLNRADDEPEEAVRAVRAAIGIDPVAVVPRRPVHAGRPPHPDVRAALDPLVRRVAGLSGRSGSSPGSGGRRGWPGADRTRPAARPARADG